MCGARAQAAQNEWSLKIYLARDLRLRDGIIYYHYTQHTDEVRKIYYLMIFIGGR